MIRIDQGRTRRDACSDSPEIINAMRSVRLPCADSHPLLQNFPISFRISCSIVTPPCEFNACPETRAASPAAKISNFHHTGKVAEKTNANASTATTRIGAKRNVICGATSESNHAPRNLLEHDLCPNLSASEWPDCHLQNCRHAISEGFPAFQSLRISV